MDVSSRVEPAGSSGVHVKRVAVDDLVAQVRLKKRHLLLDLPWMVPVVGIQERHVLALADSESVIARIPLTGILLVQIHDPPISELLDDPGGAISRAVVDQHNLQLRVGLSQCAPKRAPNVSFRVACGDNQRIECTQATWPFHANMMLVLGEISTWN